MGSKQNAIQGWMTTDTEDSESQEELVWTIKEAGTMHFIWSEEGTKDEDEQQNNCIPLLVNSWFQNLVATSWFCLQFFFYFFHLNYFSYNLQ